MTENLPTEPRTPQQLFEENVTKKLKKDIGSLIPDEVLKGMVQKTIKFLE